MNPSLSVIIPVRNCSGLRLSNCLRSLRWQQVDAAELEIILSDCGSEPEHQRALDELAEPVGARIVRTPAAGSWNRSRALNLGIRAARAEFLLCTDADMLFAENFVPAVLGAHRGSSHELMVHCQCHDLSSEAPERAWASADFPALRAQASARPTRATGACQSAGRAFFERVRGYDERYLGWGYEDLDMTSRARRAGLEIRWVSEETSMLHQWHPTRRHDRPLRRWLNCWRYRLTRHIVVKNRAGWGRAD